MLSDYLERVYAKKMAFYRRVYKNSPRWLGRTPLQNKTIVVYCEQGFGDIIQFARYFKTLKQEGCRVILHCPVELHEILGYCEGVDEFVDKNNEELPLHDYHVLSMSLPFVLTTDDTTFPYITYPHNQRLEEFDNFIKVGIAWEGNPDHSNNHERSCYLKHFKEIASIHNIQLFMLQKQINTPEYVQDCEDLDLRSIEICDFTDTASLINSMNLIISVDTSVLHLAGAMNKRTLALLSYRHDPRWKIKQWYESLDIIKQKCPYDWDGVFKELKTKVSQFSLAF